MRKKRQNRLSFNKAIDISHTETHKCIYRMQLLNKLFLCTNT